MESIRKKAIKSLGVPVSKVLDLLGLNSKEIYEYAYWRVQKFREEELENDHYLNLFTEWSGLDYEYYRDKVILDIGCGPRGSLEWASHARRRIGLDSLVDSYRKLGIDRHEMEYVHAGAESIPFDKDFFDVVTSYNSLDHVDDLERVIEEITRVLKPGGELIVVVEIHGAPTIAEPVTLPWDFLDMFKPALESVEEQYLNFNPEHAGSNAAMISRIPNLDRSGDGVVFGRLRKP